MKQPKVSVIMPVYNTEKYVKEAIQSILDQTLMDFELIVINDGSTDNSLHLVKTIPDSRIRVLSQENAGQGAARNHGLQYARGEYIYFMDSDDILDREALRECFQICEEQHVDFVFFDAINFGENYQNILTYERKHYLDEGIKAGIAWFTEQLEKNCYRVPVWLNFIRFSFLEKNGLYFETIRHEDDIFTTLLYCKAKKVAFLSKPFFHRRLRPNSVITSTYTLKDAQAYFTVAGILMSAAGKMEAIKVRAIKTFVGQMLNAAIWRGYVLPWRDKLAILQSIPRQYIYVIQIRSLLKLFFKRK
ncbi:glycosyltransferase family 2 protein [Sphingobacterium corticibacterium]|uniref:Glycosyltransferase n=1 Tax=Sphingobacterium corticibacterium TaxID=2484746 RepID=A0A4Q6XHN8_9SPHI|nr:glycosyltransferase [Sphingobacterium corticibacterium]RZF59441.1 glycosyltransferase [Sphingobacterium corticibacterium]